MLRPTRKAVNRNLVLGPCLIGFAFALSVVMDLTNTMDSKLLVWIGSLALVGGFVVFVFRGLFPLAITFFLKQKGFVGYDLGYGKPVTARESGIGLLAPFFEIKENDVQEP